jgi:hypothetical protein
VTARRPSPTPSRRDRAHVVTLATSHRTRMVRICGLCRPITNSLAVTDKSMSDAPELTDEERALGYQSWRLIGDWRAWTKRRVESIEYETATSIRRRVSVDVRLKPDFFGNPVVRWGEDYIHYVPIAQLRKHRLVRFDLRDEGDRALPLITKRQNAAIAAAMLTAVSQVAIAGHLSAIRSPIEVVDPTAIVVPRWLECEFWLLAHLDPQPSQDAETSYDVIDTFLKAAKTTNLVPIEQWEWRVADGQVTTTMTEESQWRAVLGADPGFVDLAFDIARLYLIYAPLRYEPDRRRIVKFSYSEYLGDGQSTLGQGVKAFVVRRGMGRLWNGFDDWLEGLPRCESWRQLSPRHHYA